ncbi:hypothetical protein [Flavobacterium denitrificans]|uniref:hypothetical protein n=1 Tax=Flavobacterium denitrificans TaxID=281361 RepID=UPI0004109C05|nr:hypothetical protein [Flavobacterium denitrificans]
MKYCKNTTIGHEKSVCFPAIIENAYDLFLRDGCKLEASSPFHNEENEIINGDYLENHFCVLDGRSLGNKNKSVDVIFAINENNNEKFLVFAELKLNSTSFMRLDKLSLRGKAIGSTRALGTSVPIYRKYYIIVPKDKYNEARRIMFRENPRLNNDFVALCPSDLHAKFFV